MNLSELRLQGEPGDGVVVQFGSAVLLAFDIPVGGSAFFDELLSMVKSACAESGGEVGRGLLRKVARLITRAEAQQTIPFGLIADVADSIVVLLHGAVAMTLMPSVTSTESAPLAEVMNGDDSMTWVDRVIAGDFQSLTLAAPGHVPAAQGSPLQPGTSPVAAIHVLSGPAPEPAAVQAPAGFVSVSLSGADVSALLALPHAAEQARPEPPVEAGKLLMADGTVLRLTHDYVLGREPQNAPAVVAGSAAAFSLPDEDRALSRVHAMLRVEPGSVTIADLGSANGTKIAEGDGEWTALRPHEPVRLLPGAKIRLGAQEMTFVVDPPPVPAKSFAAPPRAALDEAVADYEFVRELGSGERGAYFLAIPPARLKLDAEFVVVKVFRGATSDDAFRRATRELRAFAAAQSQYLIKIHDAGQDKGQLFYSMDFVSGGSLAAPQDPLDDAGVIRAVAQAARAAHALHEVGVVHQAIMPKNILMGAGRAYLAGLGLVQLMSKDSFATSLGDFGGLEYLDPAVLTGGPGSRATDLWSLAATLHRALSGDPIYVGLSNDPLLAIRAVLTQQPQVSPSLSPDVAAIIRSCLDADVTARPATALDLAKKLDYLLPV